MARINPASPTTTWTTIAIALCAAQATADPAFDPLPGLPGGIASIPWGISADGSTVVGLAYDAFGVSRAVRWPLGSAIPIEDLGTLPTEPAAAAQAVSADGAVVVGTSGDGNSGFAFRWTAATGMSGLGLLPGRTKSVAQAVSADGEVVVGSSYTDASDMLAYRWTSTLGMLAVHPAVGDIRSNAIGISGSGAVIVGSSFAGSGREQAVRWIAGTAHELGMPAGATACRAWSASFDGDVIVGLCTINGNDQPFRWTPAGGIMFLDLPPGFSAGQARAVSADGAAAVGFLTRSGGALDAFVWSAATGVQVLADMLGTSLPAGYTVPIAASISGDGRTIAAFCGGPGVAGLTCIITLDAPTCYANCDGSTTEPVLTVDDFTCFINEFAGAQSLPPAQQIEHYANCDGSTAEPVLTVDDFTCFINEFAAGCP